MHVGLGGGGIESSSTVARGIISKGAKITFELLSVFALSKYCQITKAHVCSTCIAPKLKHCLICCGQELKLAGKY